MTFDEVFEKLKDRFPSGILEKVETKPDPFIKINPENVHEILSFMKEELKFQTLACMSGLHYPKIPAFCVAYHPVSYDPPLIVTLKAYLPHEDGGSLRSISDIYKAALWLERETFDMYGIRFENHPQLRRILLPEDWKGFPLRKDYKTPDFYHGLPIPLHFEDQLCPEKPEAVQESTP